MASIATPQRNAPLRTRLSLLALAGVSLLAPALAPRDSFRPRLSYFAQPEPVASAPLVNVRQSSAPEIDIEAALPAVFASPPAQPAPELSTPQAAVAPVLEVVVADARRSEPAQARPAQEIVVTASVAPTVEAATRSPEATGAAAGTTTVVAATSTQPVPTASAPPLVPPAPALSGREQRLIDAINAQRTLAGVPPLVVNATLTQAARSRSQDMAANGYFAHIGPRGQSWYTALAAVGWTASAGGENLAKVAGDESTSVADAIQRLMASPTHRANIVSQAFRLVGIGAVVDPAGTTIFTTIFTDR